MDPGTVLLLTIAVAPLAAALVTSGCTRLIPPGRCHWPVIAGCGLSCAAAAGLLVLAIVNHEPGTPSRVFAASVYGWHGDAIAPRIDVAIRADVLSLALIVGAALCCTAIAVHIGRQDPRASGRRRLCAAIAAIQFAAVMLLAAASLVQVFVFWQILGIAAWLLLRNDVPTKPAMQSAGRVLLTLLAGDMFLLAAVVVCGTQLDTLSLPALGSRLSELLAMELPESVFARRAALVGLTGFLFAATIVIRCGQFPALGWVTDAGHGLNGGDVRPEVECSPSCFRSVAHGILVPVLIMPLGVYLLIRLQPLLFAAPDARWMLLVVGSLTCLLAAVVAVCEREPVQVLLFAHASQLGLMLCGIAGGTAAGLLGTVVLLFVLLTAGTALWLLFDGLFSEVRASRTPAGKAAASTTPRVVGWLAIILLVSGLGGQHAVLSSLWAAAAAGDVTQAGLAALVAAGILLTAAAVVRAWLGRLAERRSQPLAADAAHDRISAIVIAAPILLTGAAAVVMCLSLIARDRLWNMLWDVPATRSVDIAFDGPLILVTLLLAAIGAAAGWLFSIRRHAAQPGEVAVADGTTPPLIRLALRRYYLDELFFLLLVFPVRAAAQLVRFFEWLVVDGITAGLPRQVPRLAGRWTRPLDRGAGQFAALAIALAAAALLVVLTRD